MENTKEYHNAYMREWNAKNRDKIREKARNKIKTDEQKECHKVAAKKYYNANKEKCKESNRKSKQIHGTQWKSNDVNDPVRKERRRLWNKSHILENRERDRARYIRRKPKLQDYNKRTRIERNKKYLIRIKKRKESDHLFKLSRNIPTLIRTCFKRCGFSKHSKTYLILGCTFEEFKSHIETKFEPWMTWDNYGKYNGECGFGWDFDHIIPISSATSEEEIIKLNHYSNFQPLDGFTNRYVKRNKVA